METVDYGDTDYRYEIEGDSKGYDKYEKDSLGEFGYQQQEFDEGGELVNAEDDDAEAELALDLEESFDDIDE